MAYEMPVTATDIWYYFICERQVWLMMRKIEPDSEDENIEVGRFIHEYTIKKTKKEVDIENVKLDRLKKVKGEYVIEEIKKSSKYKESSRYQLLFYLDTLREMGIKAKGELVFPKEKKRETVEWTDEDKEQLDIAIANIRKIARQPVPPQPKKIKFCKKCAYSEYCWAEGLL